MKFESLLKNKHSIHSLIICVPMSSSVCGGHNTDHCGESIICLLRQSNGIPSTCFILNKFPQGFPNHICSPTTCVITMPVKFFIHNSSRLYKSKNTYNHPHTTYTFPLSLIHSPFHLTHLHPPISPLNPLSPLPPLLSSHLPFSICLFPIPRSFPPPPSTYPSLLPSSLSPLPPHLLSPLPPLTGTGSLVFSSFTVRSSIPDPSASFFPSAPPTSYRFCTSVATLVSTSGEEWGLWATPSSLEVNLSRHT